MCSILRPRKWCLSFLTLLVISITFYGTSGHAETLHCSDEYGYPLQVSHCEAALLNVPQGALPSIFTTREDNQYVTVPQRFVDHTRLPLCAITIDLDGHSKTDVFVLIPWDEIRKIAARVIERCIGTIAKGGISTFGLSRTYDAFIPPEPYDPITAQAVISPDGSVDSVAVPPDHEGGVNLPLYMTITVSGPRARPRKGVADAWIADGLQQYIKDETMRQISRLNAARLADILRAINAIPAAYAHNVLHGDRRWWEYLSLSPAKADPLTTKINCTETLGKPSVANCESALLEMTHFGPVTLDPASGPIIQVSGNCAIGIESTSKRTTTWEAIRGAAEVLLATCIQNPIASVAGGFAIGHTIRNGLPKRQSGPTPQDSGFTVAMYLQEPFEGLPSNTCAWKVASSHTGDIRQCPAPSGPWRPPERGLGTNSTRFDEWQQGNVTEMGIGNWTETQGGNFTDLTTTPNSSRSGEGA